MINIRTSFGEPILTSWGSPSPEPSLWFRPSLHQSSSGKQASPVQSAKDKVDVKNNVIHAFLDGFIIFVWGIVCKNCYHKWAFALLPILAGQSSKKMFTSISRSWLNQLKLVCFISDIDLWNQVKNPLMLNPQMQQQWFLLNGHVQNIWHTHVIFICKPSQYLFETTAHCVEAGRQQKS